MDLRSQPTCIVQSPWLDRDRSRTPLWFVINPGPAFWTECTKFCSTSIRFRYEGFRFAEGNPKGCFVDHHGHSKCATGLNLAVRAVTDNDLSGLANHFIADRTALTPAGYRHSLSSSHSLPFSNFSVLNTPASGLSCRDFINSIGQTQTFGDTTQEGLLMGAKQTFRGGVCNFRF